jgi:hypothetical protein
VRVCVCVCIYRGPPSIDTRRAGLKVVCALSSKEGCRSKFGIDPEWDKSVTRVLQDCYMSVTGVSQECYMSVTGVSQECYMSVTGVSQECH